MRRTCFFRSFSAEDILLFLLFPIHAFILARFVSDRFDDCRDMVRSYFSQSSPHAMIKIAADGQIAPAGSHSPEDEEPHPRTMKSPSPTSIL